MIFFHNNTLLTSHYARNIVFLLSETKKNILMRIISQPINRNLWGINLYPEMEGEDFIEFDSLINIRPYQGNRSRDVQDPVVRKRIVEVVNTLIL